MPTTKPDHLSTISPSASPTNGPDHLSDYLADSERFVGLSVFSHAIPNLKPQSSGCGVCLCVCVVVWLCGCVVVCVCVGGGSNISALF